MTPNKENNEKVCPGTQETIVLTDRHRKKKHRYAEKQAREIKIFMELLN